MNLWGEIVYWKCHRCSVCRLMVTLDPGQTVGYIGSQRYHVKAVPGQPSNDVPSAGLEKEEDR